MKALLPAHYRPLLVEGGVLIPAGRRWNLTNLTFRLTKDSYPLMRSFIVFPLK